MHKILCDLTDIWNNGNESQKQYAADLANTLGNRIHKDMNITISMGMLQKIQGDLFIWR